MRQRELTEYTFKDLNDDEIFKDVDVDSLQLGYEWADGDVKALKHYMEMEMVPELMLPPLGEAPREWDDDTPHPTAGELMELLRPHLVSAAGDNAPTEPVTLGALMPALRQADLEQLLEAAKVTAHDILDKLQAAEGATRAEDASSSSSSSEEEDEGAAEDALGGAAEVEEDLAVGLLAALASAKAPADKLRAMLMWADVQHPGALKMEDELSQEEAEWVMAKLAEAEAAALETASALFAASTAADAPAEAAEAEAEAEAEEDEQRRKDVAELRGVLSHLSRKDSAARMALEGEGVQWHMGRLHFISSQHAALSNEEFEELKADLEAKWAEWELEWEDKQARRGGSVLKNVKEEEKMMDKVVASVPLDPATEKFVKMAAETIKGQATWSYATKQKVLAGIMERV